MKKFLVFLLIVFSFIGLSCNNPIKDESVTISTPAIEVDVNIETAATVITSEKVQVAKERIMNGLNYVMGNSSQENNENARLSTITKDAKLQNNNFTIFIPLSEGLSVKIFADGERYVKIIYDDAIPKYYFDLLLDYSSGECILKDLNVSDEMDIEGWGEDAGNTFDHMVKECAKQICSIIEHSVKYAPNSDNSYEFYIVSYNTEYDEDYGAIGENKFDSFKIQMKVFKVQNKNINN